MLPQKTQVTIIALTKAVGNWVIRQGMTVLLQLGFYLGQKSFNMATKTFNSCLQELSNDQWIRCGHQESTQLVSAHNPAALSDDHLQRKENALSQ